MAEAEISSAKEAGAQALAGYGAPSSDGQTYFEALVAALSQPTPGSDEAAAEPPLFTAASHWQPWREEDLFLARPPHPLPRPSERMAAPAASGPDRGPGDVAAAPGSEMSNFRRLLAPAAILSLLVLAAITHGAVANRAAGLRSEIKLTEAREPPPFSLSGQWRRLGRRDESETPRIAAFVTKPPQPAETSPALPAGDETHVVASAIEAIATLPLITASFTPITRADAIVSANTVTEPAPPAPPTMVPTAAVPAAATPPPPHYSSTTATPLTSFQAGEPDSAPPQPNIPVKLIVAKVTAVEAVRSGATNATHAQSAGSEAVVPAQVQKAAAKTAAKTVEPDPPQVKKKPKATQVRATPQAAPQNAAPATPRAPDTVMRDSP